MKNNMSNETLSELYRLIQEIESPYLADLFRRWVIKNVQKLQINYVQNLECPSEAVEYEAKRQFMVLSQTLFDNSDIIQTKVYTSPNLSKTTERSILVLGKLKENI